MVRCAGIAIDAGHIDDEMSGIAIDAGYIDGEMRHVSRSAQVTSMVRCALSRDQHRLHR